MVCFSPVGYGVRQLTFRALTFCSDEGLTFETSAAHNIQGPRSYFESGGLNSDSKWGG